MNITQSVAAVNKFNKFVIPNTKARNEQCNSKALFVSAKLKLTGVPQSITDEIYNEVKRNRRGWLSFKRIWESFLRTKHSGLK